MSSWYVVDMMAALYFSWCWRQSLLVCSKYRALHDVFEWLGMWFGDVCHQKCWRHPSANTRYFRYLKMLNDMMQSKPAVSLYFPQPLFSDCSVDQYQHIKRKQKKTHSNQIRDYKRGFPEFVFEMFRDVSRWFEMVRDVSRCFGMFRVFSHNLHAVATVQASLLQTGRLISSSCTGVYTAECAAAMAEKTINTSKLLDFDVNWQSQSCFEPCLTKTFSICIILFHVQCTISYVLYCILSFILYNYIIRLNIV